MPNRLTKIYTRKGDDGYTSMNNQRLSKDDLLIEAIGTLDELNSAIGFVIALCKLSDHYPNPEVERQLISIQHEIFDLGGELHVPQRVIITADKVTTLEMILDAWNAELPPLKEFVLPGGNTRSAACHVARTVCRRAERSLVRLHRTSALTNLEIIRYVNRLSDLLFVMARVLARENGTEEILWNTKR